MSIVKLYNFKGSVNAEYIGKNMDEQKFYEVLDEAWCLQKVCDYRAGLLTEEEIAELDSRGFQWELYEKELDKLESKGRK